MHDGLGMGIIERVDGTRECVDESGGESVGALRAAYERRRSSAREGLQGGPGLVDSIVARATERAADDVEKAPSPLTPDVLGNRLDLRLENEWARSAVTCGSASLMCQNSSTGTAINARLLRWREGRLRSVLAMQPRMEIVGPGGGLGLE
jgi:hypothetical protein